MRRRTLQRLAHIGRGTCLLIAAAAAGTAWVWNYRATWVEQIDSWLVRKSHGPYQSRLEAALAAGDAARSEALLEQLAEDLHFVKRQDHLAYVLTACLRRLSELREQADDLPAAIEWMAEAVAFDDHELHSVVRLAELRCRRPESQKQGEEELQALWQKFPGSPWVAPALVRQLAARGDAEKALDVVEQSIGAIESNLWTIVWNDAGARPDSDAAQLDRSARRADLLPTLEDGVLRLRFSIREPNGCSQLRIFLPPFSSFALLQPRLRVLGGDRFEELDLAACAGECVHLRRSEARIETFGESGPYLTATLGARTPGAAFFEISGRFEPTHSALLLAPLRGPAFAQIERALAIAGADARLERLRQLRGLALAQTALQLFWRPPGGDFSGDNSLPVAPGLRVVDGTARFATTATIGKEADQLRLDLPEDVGVRWRIERIDVTTARGDEPIDPATVAFLFSHDLQRQGNELTVTGNDPYFAFALPAGGGRVERVSIAGSVR